MLSVLKNRTYRHLFLAQAVALTGTGLATVALGLLAYDLAGEQAGLVLGIALTIKMVAYVLIAPIASALIVNLNRRAVLVALDLIRASVLLILPFVTEIWQIYVLIFVLQSASAGFTPTFQATIPDILTDEEDYTKALSLSRLAMDAESLLSPVFAAALLTWMSFDNLFWGTALGFTASALLVISVALPSAHPSKTRGFYERTTRGLKIYLKTPRLRGLLALNWTISAVVSLVFVNTVVIVKTDLGRADAALAIALAGFGAGSMLASLLIPRLLHVLSDRTTMICGGAFATAALGAIPFVGTLDLRLLVAGWFCIGFAYSLVLTPAGRVLARSAHPEDRPAVFAAQFTLSHACWLIFYPLTGWLLLVFGTSTAMCVQSALGFFGVIAALKIWPRNSSAPIPHAHRDLPSDHTHLAGHKNHVHSIIIDDLHPRFTPRR
ncbi:MFS transporter [Shimia thalassica]|uniref:MFS transporter n=1 Tax=Shimia thalassica TaxID=1715693 RepID=UPI0026E29EA5|nr:MFS transporter [Shimia thalassica]MDO6485036.1 MFS transporter [Shimia thalassica]